MLGIGKKRNHSPTLLIPRAQHSRTPFLASFSCFHDIFHKAPFPSPLLASPIYPSDGAARIHPKLQKHSNFRVRTVDMPMWKIRTVVTFPSVLPSASWFSSLLLRDMKFSAFNYTVLKGGKIQSKAWEEEHGDKPEYCFSDVCADPTSNHPAHHRRDSKPALQKETGS